MSVTCSQTERPPTTKPLPVVIPITSCLTLPFIPRPGITASSCHTMALVYPRSGARPLRVLSNAMPPMCHITNIGGAFNKMFSRAASSKEAIRTTCLASCVNNVLPRRNLAVPATLKCSSWNIEYNWKMMVSPRTKLNDVSKPSVNGDDSNSRMQKRLVKHNWQRWKKDKSW
jgi:hypothetical protein